jgi:diguanylate cyclase (GGDEF)-like protein/PAS domain S-box-containing protein
VSDHAVPADAAAGHRSVATPDEVAAWVAQFAPVMTAASAPMVLIGADGHILHANPRYSELVGRAEHDLVGLPLTTVLHPDDVDSQREAIRCLFSGEWPEWQQMRRYARPDGSFRYGLLHTRPVLTDGGAVLGLFSQLQDVTARRDAELRLARSEERFRLAMDHAPVGVVLAGPDGRWLMANRALCRILGRAEDDLVGLTFEDLTHPADLPDSQEMSRRVYAGELDSFDLHKRYIRGDGTYVRVRLTVAFTRDEDGRPDHAVAHVEDLTEERRITAELAEKDRRFRMLTEDADDVIALRLRTVPEFAVEHVSRGIEAILGRAPEEFYADPVLLLSLVHPEDAPALAERLADPVAYRDVPQEFRVLRDDGAVAWIQARGEPIFGGDGTAVGIDGLAWDITARKEAEEAAAAGRRRFQALVEHAADAVVIRDPDGVVLYASPAVTRILGDVPEEIVGTIPSLRLPEDQVAVLQDAVARATATPGGVAHTEVRVHHRDGTEKVLALAISNRLDDPDIGGLVNHIQDITASRAAQQELVHQAAHDALTGLPNRTSLQRHLERALADDPSGVGVVFLDLIGLKPVNDTLGHVKGDAILTTVARRIAAVVGTDGMVGRFGGDEFAIVATGLDRGRLTALAHRVVGALDEPVTAPDGGQVHLGAAAGLALAEPGTTAEQLLTNADLAMYDVQRRTGRGVQGFDATLAQQATARLGTERDLRAADLDRDLRAHYQPVVHLATGRVSAAEALLRWQHPTRGLVPPGLFIPVAEETGLIDRLGLWVLDHACRQQVAWADHDVTVEVNLSPRQLFDPELPRRVADVLTRTGARADRLMLEVTESALIDDRVARSALAALEDLGVGLALDDFGTGFSSLTSLRRYPFDTVKIDRSFVAEITGNPRDRSIVRNIINLAHDLGMKIVAEGVETAEQLSVLTDIGADAAQGYHLGRPAPAADLRLSPGIRAPA